MEAIEPSGLRVLGVDPGLRVTGWGMLADDDGTLRLLGCGVFAPDVRLPLSERLACLEAGLNEVVQRWRPAEVAVEEPFVAENVRSAMAIGEARAVALLVAGRAGLPVGRYAPAEVKRLVTGYGRSDKGQVQAMLRMQLELTEPLPSADAADAVAVALCHALRRRMEGLVESRGKRT